MTFVDAGLPHGSRLHFTIRTSPAGTGRSISGWFVVRATDLGELVALDTITVQAAQFLEAAVVSGLNILVAGGTQAGNPTTAEDTPGHSDLKSEPWACDSRVAR